MTKIRKAPISDPITFGVCPKCGSTSRNRRNPFTPLYSTDISYKVFCGDCKHEEEVELPKTPSRPIDK